MGDVSQLTLDPQQDSYYLMNALLLQTPELGDQLSRVRVQANRLIASQAPARSQVDQLGGLMSTAENTERRLDSSLSKLMALDPRLKNALQSGARAASLEVRSTRELVDQLGGENMDAARACGQILGALAFAGPGGTAGDAGAPALRSLKDRRDRSPAQAAEFARLGWRSPADRPAGGRVHRPRHHRAATPCRWRRQPDRRWQLERGADIAKPKDEIGVLSRAFDRMITSFASMCCWSRTSPMATSPAPSSRSRPTTTWQCVVDMVTHLSDWSSEVHKSGHPVNTRHADFRPSRAALHCE